MPKFSCIIAYSVAFPAIYQALNLEHVAGAEVTSAALLIVGMVAKVAGHAILAFGGAR